MYLGATVDTSLDICLGTGSNANVNVRRSTSVLVGAGLTARAGVVPGFCVTSEQLQA